MTGSTNSLRRLRKPLRSSRQRDATAHRASTGKCDCQVVHRSSDRDVHKPNLFGRQRLSPRGASRRDRILQMTTLSAPRPLAAVHRHDPAAGGLL